MKKLSKIVFLIFLCSVSFANPIYSGWFEKNTVTHVYDQEIEMLGFTIKTDYLHSIVHCAGLGLHCNITEPYVTKFSTFERVIMTVL
jgi:hypothetical protein